MLSNFSFANGAIAYTSPSSGTALDPIDFNGYSLQRSDGSVVTTKINWDDMKNIEFNTFNAPRANGGGVINRFYRWGTVQLQVNLNGTTISGFQTLCDTFKKSLQQQEGYLTILVGTEYRRCKVTCTDLNLNREHYNVTFTHATLTFTTVEPFFYAVTDQGYTDSGVTITPYFSDWAHYGTAPSEPKTFIIIGAAPTFTSFTLSVAGRSMTVASTYSAGDILIIDSKNKSVTKNGTAIDYSGTFFQLPPWSNPVTITTVGSGTYDITSTVPKTYI